MKRALLVCTQMELGGVQIRALELKRFIEERGGKVDIVFLYRKSAAIAENESIIAIFHEKTKNPISLLKGFFKLLRLYKNGQYASVVGFAHYASPIATTLGLFFGIKSRIATQTNPPHDSKFAAVPLDKFCGAVGIYTANIAASEAIFNGLKDYPQRYRSTLKIIHNGIRPIEPSMSRADARNKFGFREGEKILINCGRLSHQKNQSFLIDILKRLPTDYRCVIVGEGELKSELENKAKDANLSERFSLIGRIPPQDIADFMHAGDVFAFPSIFEAFGLAMVEAMAAGTPVVSSDYPALVEVAGDGAITLPLDAALWAAEIENLISRPYRDTQAAKGIARSQNFSSDAMSAKFYAEMFGCQSED
ncbi:glycosyltransferase family 4 protein [Novosphingobium sp.]|uniref:glycosyltransferase family 4 protein n=1 Tax=Novosphingobium sp. TaxID=1874826 RepID=UPI002FDE0C5E